MSSLTGSIEQLMTSGMVERLSARNGVPVVKTRNGISAAVATILDGLVEHAHDPLAMDRLDELLASTAKETPDELLEDESSLHQHSTQLLSIVGGDPRTLAARIARYAGLGSGAASALVGGAVSVVIGAFHKLGGMDADTLSTTLTENADELHAAVPPKMTANGSGRSIHRVDTAIDRPIEDKRVTRWLPVILVGAAAFGVLWWLARPPDTAPLVATAGHSGPWTEAASGSDHDIAFPNQPAESALLVALRHHEAQNQWIALDDVEFPTGRVTLVGDSDHQLTNVSHVLAAYPEARVVVEGYGDEPGDDQLARGRANAIRDALISRGIASTRIEARGGDARHAAISVIEP